MSDNLDEGFTQIELLVVLGILAVVAAMTFPSFLTFDRGWTAERYAGRLAVELRRARASAISKGQTTSFVIFQDRDAVSAKSDGRQIPIPTGLRLKIDGVRAAPMRDRRAMILFFADGSASGGRILVTDDKGSTELSVEWITGAVETRHVLERL